MPSKRILQACAALLLVAVALAPLGCKAKSAVSGQTDAGASVLASGSAGATSTAGSTAGTEGAGASAGSSARGSSGSKLNTSEAAALDAELAAIQTELDKMSVPSDADFGGIASGLK